MATITHLKIKTAQLLYDTTSKELEEISLVLRTKIHTMNGISKNYGKIDALKGVPQQIVDLFPAIAEIHARGLRALEELQRTFDRITERPSLSSRHLVVQLEENISSLRELMTDFEDLEDAFTEIFNNTFYIYQVS